MNKEQRIIESAKLHAVPSSVVYNEDCVEALKRFPDKHFDLAIVISKYFLYIYIKLKIFKYDTRFKTITDRESRRISCLR